MRDAQDVSGSIVLRRPQSEMGAKLFSLVSQCPPLDPNSMYCNLLQCSHFADTCIAAERGEELVGFMSGYWVPDREHKTLFVWQVAVAESARGQGLASRMLEALVQRCSGVEIIETTITSNNAASWKLFESFARRHDVTLQSSVMFDHTVHFQGQHDTENLVRLGPLVT